MRRMLMFQIVQLQQIAILQNGIQEQIFTSSVILEYNDPFEGTLYRTHASEVKVDIQFLTNVLFDSFQKKSAQTT